MLLSIIVALTVAQSDAESIQQAYLVTITGMEPFYGFVEVLGGGQLKITPDTPWNSVVQIENKTEQDVIYEEEPKSARQGRLEREGAKAGFVQVNGAWVPKEEKEYSDRAKDMVNPAEDAVSMTDEESDSFSEIEAGPSTDANGDVSASNSARGFSQWLPHLGMAAIGIVLVALIYRFMIVSA